MSAYELTGNNFIIITQEKIKSYIEKARTRVVYAKPAFYKGEMQTLLQAAERGVLCDVYLDRGDMSIRRGFGDAEALKCIKNAEKLPETFKYHFKNKIRLAFLIVDDTAVVFAPNIRAFENETEAMDFPNGVMCQGELAKEAARMFIRELVHHDKPTKTVVVNLGGGEDSGGEDEEPEQIQTTVTVNEPENPEKKQEELDEAIEVLEENPAIKPEELQQTLVYSINYKTMRVITRGSQIDNRQISLRPFYEFIGVTPKNALVEWKVMDAGAKELLTENKDLRRKLNEINRKYQREKLLFDAREYGYIIDATAVNDYIKETEEAKESYKNSYKTGNDKETDTLQRVLDDSENKLRNLLYKHCCDNYEAFKNALARDIQYAKFVDRSNIMTMFTRFMDETDYLHTVLNFPTRETLLDKLSLKITINDISNENLKDPEFKAILDKYNLKPRDYEDGFTRKKEKVAE